MSPTAEVSRRASGFLEQVTNRLEKSFPNVLEAWPLSRYVWQLEAYPETSRLGYRSPQIREMCAGIKTVAGQSGLDLYHRALLLTLILRAPQRLPEEDYPEEIVQQFQKDFERILRDIASASEDEPAYLYSRSAFLKDLALCNLRLIPAGVVKVIPARLPPRIFFTSGFRGGREALWLLIRQRGLSPYYEMHMHSQDQHALREFSPEGWNNYYLRLAELLRRRKWIKGAFGTAWLYDPALADISPRLIYLRKGITENGGRLFRIGRADENGIRDAVLKSGTRRRLYEKGEYTPMEYLAVWPRQELLAWAEGRLSGGLRGRTG